MSTPGRRVSTIPRRFASTLVVLEAKDGKLSSDGLNSVAAAVHIKGPITGLVVGNGIGADTQAAREASSIGELDGVMIPNAADSGDYVGHPKPDVSKHILTITSGWPSMPPHSWQQISRRAGTRMS